MSISQLEIIGYRGFSKKGIINFALPNGKEGSGLTVITGSNNSGKSSILECLRARSGNQPVSFTVGTRNADLDYVSIVYTIREKIQAINSISAGASETKKKGIDPNFEIFVLPSRRTFNPYFGRGENSRKDYVGYSYLPPQRASLLNNFESRLFTILKSPERFNDLLAEVLGFEPSWTIDQSDQGNYFLKFRNGRHSHSSDGMGEGIISVFSIIDALYDSDPGQAVVIDEPELSLHPSLQKRLAKLFLRLSRDRQIIISTHSPSFVDLSSLKVGGHIARVISTESGTSIKQMGPAGINAINKLHSDNINNPHVFGLNSKELFFQEDGIILVEGQEDVLLLPRVAVQLGISFAGHFFGWGVGGASNMMHLCIILQQLGFSKVAGFLDGDKINERENLKKSFPSYHFDCIPAKDIRTKSFRAASPAISVLLDEHMKIRSEFIDDTTQVFRRFAAYLSSSH